MYYEEKIEYIIKEFKQLFIEMLEIKQYPNAENLVFFSSLLNAVKKCYPEKANILDRINYYYSEVQDSEEKLEFLMLLYKNLKEV